MTIYLINSMQIVRKYTVYICFWPTLSISHVDGCAITKNMSAKTQQQFLFKHTLFAHYTNINNSSKFMSTYTHAHTQAHTHTHTHTHVLIYT
jgi:hypothetical protein